MKRVILMGMTALFVWTGPLATAKGRAGLKMGASTLNAVARELGWSPAEVISDVRHSKQLTHKMPQHLVHYTHDPGAALLQRTDKGVDVARWIETKDKKIGFLVHQFDPHGRLYRTTVSVPGPKPIRQFRWQAPAKKTTTRRFK